METEHDRLARLYAELGDDHLRDLADEPEDLTDDARLVLAAELRKRNLVAEPTGDETDEAEPAIERESGFGAGIPGMFPSGAAIVEQALEPGGEELAGFVGLIVFYDGHELTRACSALDDSEVEFAIEEKAGDALVGAPSGFEVWVAVNDVDLAKRVLREKMGLFPVAEIEAPIEAPGENATALLGTFETHAEAAEVLEVLQEGGIHPTLREPDAQEDAAWWSVEVPATELDRGLTLVAAKLQMEP